MSDNLEKELEKEIKACKEETDEDVAREVDKFYNILRKLPERIRRGLQCKIYDIPLTKHLIKTYSDLINEEDN